MPVDCYKPFSIKVTQAITAYWTLNEASAGSNRVDSVGGSDLIPLFPNAPGLPALHGNGVLLSWQNANRGYQASSAHLQFAAGQSFSLWGWFNILGVGPGGALLSYYSSTQQMTIELANSDNFGNVHIYEAPSGNDTAFNVSLNAWHFFHIFYNGPAAKHGFSIDGGVETFIDNSPWGSQSMAVHLQPTAGLQSANSSAIWDEIGITVGSKLTGAQVAYLYDAGFGRTWPITLP